MNIRTFREAYEIYERMLDDNGPVEIAGMDFYPSEILKKLDRVAYDTGFNDYMDAIGVDTDELVGGEY